MTIINIDFTGGATRYFEPKPKTAEAYICRHRTLVVDDHLREVSCERCGKIVDAFDYLSGLANDEIKLFEQMARLRKEKDELIQRVEALQREERNLKARLKTANKKAVKAPPKPAALATKDKQSCLDEIKQKLGK